MEYKAPFPYFGGKSAVAAVVWERFGNVPNYIEPFFGSGAVLLNRPHEPRIETVNDLSGFISNFWRAVQADPDAVAYHADQIVSEVDLHARHAWLVRQSVDLNEKMLGDPEYYDSKIAGWWVWGLCAWIGGEWCGGNGSWSQQETEVGIRLVHGGNGGAVKRKPQLGSAGQGVNRLTVVDMAGDNAGTGECGIYAWMAALSQRLRRVRVCCGDWSRVVTPVLTVRHGITAIFLDPPYTAEAGRDNRLYERESATVGHDVAAWAIENGDDPMFRIALCGYEGEYNMPANWENFKWKAWGGMGNLGNGAGRENRMRERIWFSPHCLRPAAKMKTLSMFDAGFD